MDPEHFVGGVRGPASDQGGSYKVLPFQNPYPGKLSVCVCGRGGGSGPLVPSLDLSMSSIKN